MPHPSHDNLVPFPWWELDIRAEHFTTLLSDIAKKTTPKPLASVLPQDIVVPSFVRDSLKQLIEPLKNAKSNAGIIPLLDQSLDVLEQIPSLKKLQMVPGTSTLLQPR